MHTNITKFIACCILAISNLHTVDKITIKNKTPIDFFAAAYYRKSASERIAKPFFIPAGKSVTIDRPPRKLNYDRQVYLSIGEEGLAKHLTRGQSDFMPNFNIGTLHGTKYYIIASGHKIVGYNEFDKAVQPILQSITGPFQKIDDALFNALQKSYTKYAHKTEKAMVTTTPDLSQEEQAYLQRRLPIVKAALMKLLGENLADHEVPRIAFCASGGGYRAMISFLGSLTAAKDIGLLDGITYCAGLSGGAWATAIAAIVDNPLQNISSRLNKPITADIQLKKFLNILWRKFVFDQPLSSIDIYGLMLANRFFGGAVKDPFKLTLSKTQQHIEFAQHPLPIYTAIMTKEPYEWMEFTPYTVGSTYLKGFIPSWGFNRPFAKGSSVESAPEQPLGFLLGIWGSAFSANIREAYNEIRSSIDSPILLSALDAGTSEELLGNKRILPAKAKNFTYTMPTSPRWQQQNLTLIDAGLAFNLPTPPLLRKERAVDIIIIFDNSMDVRTLSDLIKAEQYAQQKGLPFPKIYTEHVADQPCTVFHDKENPEAPIVIYCPLIKNTDYSTTFDPENCIAHSFCATENFIYKPQQVEQLSGLTRYTLEANKDIIIQAIRDAVERKR